MALFARSILAIVLFGGLASVALAQSSSYSFTPINDPLVAGLAVGSGTIPSGINSAGQIAGTYTVGSMEHGFIYSCGTFSTIDFPGAIGGTQVNGINNKGEIVGIYNDGSGDHGFLYSGGNFAPINDPSASPGSFGLGTGGTGGTGAWGINDSEQIVGGYVDAVGLHGFLYDHESGAFTSIDAPGAVEGVGSQLNGTRALGINDVGQIVGVYVPGDGSGYHGFLYVAGRFTDILDPIGTGCCGQVGNTQALGINNVEIGGMYQIVGLYIDGSGIHGFVDSYNVFATVDDPLAPSQGFSNPPGVLSYAVGISDKGQIVGPYFDANGHQNGYLATPSPAVAINVTSPPSGLTVVVDGASCTTPGSFSWTSGSCHTFSASTQPGGTGIQYVPGTFPQSECFTANATFNVPFTTQYLLTTAAETGGTISPTSGWYNAGTGVPVAATTNAGYAFTGFTGALTGTTTPQTVTMNAPESVTADFSMITCTYALTPTSALVGAASTSGSVGVIAPSGCPWTASNNSLSWASITSGTSGSGNGTVDYSVQNNALSGGRSGSLTIAGITFPLTQAGQGCQITLNPAGASLGSASANSSFSLGLSGSDCSWTATASSTSTWVTVNSSGTGTGTGGTIGYSVTSNSGSSLARTGAIDIGVTSPSVASTQAVFNVTQAGTACNYTLAQPGQSFSSGGGSGSVGVVAQGGCTWTAVSNNTSWLTIASGGSGSGNGTVTYSVQSNPSSVARSGSLTIAGTSYVVTQAGTTTAPSCAASMQSVPQVAVEGRTEVVGTLVLTCSGLSISITADVFLTLNTSITNAVISGTTSDASLQVNGTATQDAQVVSYSTIHWPGVVISPANGGTSASVTLSNVRADASLLAAGSAITGQVSVNSLLTVALPVTNANLTMATAVTTLALSVGTAYSGSGGYILPLIYQEVVSPSTPPLRFRMVLTNVPSTGLLYAPVNPMGGTTAIQLYSADCSGFGGSAISGTLQGGVLYSPLTVTGGVTTATWVVQPGTPVTALTFPLLWTGPASALTQIQVIGSYAPVSPGGTAACGSANPSAAAVPRYRDFSVPLQFSNFRVTPMITMSNTGFVTYSASVTDESGQSGSQSAKPLAIAHGVKADASNTSTATLSCVLVGASGSSGICSPPTGQLSCSGQFQLSPPYPPNAPLSCGVTSPNPPANGGGGAVDVVAVPAMNVQIVQPPQTVSGTYTFTGIAIDPLVSVGSVLMTVSDSNNNVVASGAATIGVSNTTQIPLIATDCNAYSQWFGCPSIGFTYSLNTTLLPNGSYKIQALATNTDTPTASVPSATQAFVVSNSGPSLAITSPANGATVTTSNITVSGTATDAGLGNNGISSVTVNGVQAIGDTAAGANIANWSAQITLLQGANTITVVAKDASFNENATTQTISVTLPGPCLGIPGFIGMFFTTTDLDCSAMDQSVFQGNPAVSVGVPTTYYGAMTLVGNVGFGDAAGMALYNAGGGAGASVSLDLYNTAANGGIPQAKIKAIDDGNYSDNLTFWTKAPGSSTNAVTERVRITSTGSVGIGTTNPSLGPLQMGSGAYVTPGGVWTNASDRNLKENFVPVIPSAILLKIDALPVTEWNYINEDPSVRHIGPVAQDFFSIFGVGNSSISISTIDPSGIALAGIQGLDQKVQGRAAQIAELKKELEAKTEELRALQERLARLESLLEPTTSGAK